MSYPAICINLKKLKENERFLIDKFDKKGIDLAFVTKVFCGDPTICETLVENGCKYLADSRIENLMGISDIDIEKILLRIPMHSEIESVIEYSDISLNSSVETIEKLNSEAEKKGKKHKIILMLDMGDLREGYFYEEDMYNAVEKILTFKNIELFGVGTNLTCYGGIIPSEENLGKLISLKEEFEKRFNINIPVVSGGNSSSLDLLFKNDLPGITNLRLGEALVLGTESAYGTQIEGMHHDIFTLKAEIVEIKDKPSMPIGVIGMDAFGNVPSFTDIGIRRRAIIAVGKQDVDFEKLIPLDEKISFLGGSSDHTILDVTDSDKDYKLGDIIEFRLKYPAILSLMTSKYIKREYI